MTFLPKTKLGRWSFGLIIAMFPLFFYWQTIISDQLCISTIRRKHCKRHCNETKSGFADAIRLYSGYNFFHLWFNSNI